MHTLEPHWGWRHKYSAELDERSPFHGAEYSEFEYSQAVYDHYIHPQWDSMGSSTLYLKLLFVDHDAGYCIVELIGEWNDLLHNDIMLWKRNIAEHLMMHGVFRFVLLCGNVLAMHPGDDDYYAEWAEELAAEDGWVAMLDLQVHVRQDLIASGLDQYLTIAPELDRIPWRTMTPEALYEKVSSLVHDRM